MVLTISFLNSLNNNNKETITVREDNQVLKIKKAYFLGKIGFR